MYNHKILLPNRWGEKNYLVPIGNNTFTIEWSNPGSTISVHYADADRKVIHALDPSGGPFIKVGDTYLKWVITEILFDTENKRWLIKVKKDDLPSNKTTKNS